MLNFYQKCAKFYHNDNVFHAGLCNLVLTSEIPNSYKEEVTWENLSEYIRQGKLPPYSHYYDRRKGKIFSYGDVLDSWHFSVAEWKEPLNIQIEYDFLPANPSIEKIMKYPDGGKAIQYLVERGISIMGK